MPKKSVLKDLLAITLIPFFLNSCDKNNDPEPLPCLLTSSVTTSGGYTYTYTLTYDNQKVISSTSTSQAPNGGSGSATINYAYNSAGNLSEITSASSYREVYSYTNGEITKKESFNNSNSLLDQTDYEYSNGRLTKVQEYSLLPGSTSLAKEAYQTYEYATATDKNPAIVKFFSTTTSTTPGFTYENTYTDQKNAFAAAPAGLQKYLKLTGGSDNAIAKVVITSPTGTQTLTYTYEFNTEGYPTKRIETYAVGSLVNTTIYTYTCN